MVTSPSPTVPPPQLRVHHDGWEPAWDVLRGLGAGGGCFLLAGQSSQQPGSVAPLTRGTVAVWILPISFLFLSLQHCDWGLLACSSAPLLAWEPRASACCREHTVPRRGRRLCTAWPWDQASLVSFPGQRFPAQPRLLCRCFGDSCYVLTRRPDTPWLSAGAAEFLLYLFATPGVPGSAISAASLRFPAPAHSAIRRGRGPAAAGLCKGSSFSVSPAACAAIAVWEADRKSVV